MSCWLQISCRFLDVMACATVDCASPTGVRHRDRGWTCKRLRNDTGRLGGAAGRAEREIRTGRLQVLFEKPLHSLPGLVGAGDVVGRAAFVEKGVRRVVAIYFG